MQLSERTRSTMRALSAPLEIGVGLTVACTQFFVGTVIACAHRTFTTRWFTTTYFSTDVAAEDQSMSKGTTCPSDTTLPTR
jgi:hypothetical protein